VRNLDAAKDELAPGDQLMNVIADANVNHEDTVIFSRATKKKFPELSATDETRIEHRFRTKFLCVSSVFNPWLNWLPPAA
jgi:UDP-N-acetylmuramate-alanine ligase